MLWTDTDEGNFLTNTGGVMLAEQMTFPGLCKVIESQGYLCVSVPTPGPAQRSQLSMLIEEAIEVCLEKLGAVAPGVGASVDVDASISDQLYRARLIEKRGIVLLLPNLEGMANAEQTLDGEDSVALIWWMQATQERPLGLVIDSENRRLNVYPAPVPFESLLRSSTYPPPPPRAVPEQAHSSDTMHLSGTPGIILPCAVAPSSHEPAADRANGNSDTISDFSEMRANTATFAVYLASDLEAVAGEHLEAAETTPSAGHGDSTDRAALNPNPAHQTPADESPSFEAVIPALADSDDAAPLQALPMVTLLPCAPEADLLGAPPHEEPHTLYDAMDVHAARTLKAEPHPEILEAVRRAREESRAPSTSSDAPAAETLAADGSAASEPLAEASESGSEPAPHESSPVPSSKTERSRRAHTVETPADAEASDPFHRLAQREWPNWLRELHSTRGPKPLAVVERTFVSAYTPLREAWIRNIAGPEAKLALKTFADSFSHSYSEAFDALRVRGKRPTMVLDTPEIAQRVGRLHGARSIQLVMIDGMRFDLGLRIQDRLRSLARGEASLAERLLLWSALPTTTETQLLLIGKGPSGLKEPLAPSDTPVVVARGKNAGTPRRIKAGHRELIKLDTIESHLSVPGKREPERLDEIADDVAQALRSYFEKLPPRTLVMTFGDHGFLLDPLDGGTSRARSGGASPEEVLVPAFAWLVGSVH